MITVDTDARVIRNGNLETRYSSSDFVNPDSYDGDKAFIILDGGFVQAIVFSEYYSYSESDALDEAVDRGKLDGYQVTESELSDYVVGHDSEGYPEYEGITHLGNASEPFDLGAFDLWVIPARLFSEDTSLMTCDRVATRLDEMLDAADTVYKATDVHSDNWSEAYQRTKDLEDAITLFRLMCSSRT